MSPLDFVIIGHRGAAGLAAENTLSSFGEALAWHCPMIELDVHRSTDAGGVEHLLVIHDSKLNRTTNGKGKLEDFDADYLRTLDAGAGQQIPLLEEVMDLLLEHQANTGTTVALNIELKGAHTAQPVARFIKRFPTWPMLVSSFDHDELRQFRSLDQSTAVAPLYDRFAPDWRDTAAELSAVAVNIATRVANPARVTAMRDAGYMVFVYTVNDEKEARTLQNMGASGVFTDRPDRLMRR